MNTLEMSEKQWQLAEGLARNLARQRVSHNLLRDAIAFYNRFPGADNLLDWLERLTMLGSTFASGRVDITQAERGALKMVLEADLRKYPREDWALILAWAARLMIYYLPQKQEWQKKQGGQRRSYR